MSGGYSEEVIAEITIAVRKQRMDEVLVSILARTRERHGKSVIAISLTAMRSCHSIAIEQIEI